MLSKAGTTATRLQEAHMKIKQLSLFIENKTGTLNSVCQVLQKNNLNIQTLSLADTQQFGILRLLVSEWERAEKVLEEAGFVVKITEVLALPVEDHPGGLASILNILDRNQLSVEYIYAFTFGKNNTAAIVFRFEDPDKAEEILGNCVFTIVCLAIVLSVVTATIVLLLSACASSRSPRVSERSPMPVS